MISTTSGGAAVNTSGSQSGTHSLYFCPYGLGDGSTTFNVPDLRGNIPAGLDNMGGTAANRINTGVNSGQTVGGLGGEQGHTLTMNELPGYNFYVNNNLGQGTYFNFGATYFQQYIAGGGAAHNTLQPYMLVNWIIKAI